MSPKPCSVHVMGIRKVVEGVSLFNSNEISVLPAGVLMGSKGVWLGRES